MNIKYDGNMSGKGCAKNRPLTYQTLDDYLANSPSINSNKVRKRLLKEGYKKHQCEHCGLSTWDDKPIPLELHHINGNRYDNRIENFQLLCPNCHALTDSYRGKNARKNK